MGVTLRRYTAWHASIRARAEYLRWRVDEQANAWLDELDAAMDARDTARLERAQAAFRRAPAERGWPDVPPEERDVVLPPPPVDAERELVISKTHPAEHRPVDSTPVGAYARRPRRG